MSISTGSTRKAGPYSGNGSNTAFPFAFKVFKSSDVLVVQTDTTPADNTLTLDTHYTVTLNANQDANPGGTVNMATAPPSGYLLTIGSDLPQLQSVTLTNNGGFYPTVINNALDYITILVQQLSEKFGRALVMPFSTNASGKLPPVSPGSLLGWKQDGSGIDNVGATGVGAGGIVASNMAAGAAGSALSTDTNATAAKATPADADTLPLFDSADFWNLKKLTWSNLRNALFSSLNIPVVQNYSGKVWEGTPGTGAKVRRYADSIAATTGNIEIGESYNCDLDPVSGVWSGRDVTDICWLEKWTDAGGVKEFWYAPSAAAGTVPAWQRRFVFDLANGNFIGNIPSTIQPVLASVAANALTITLDPTVLEFRNAALGTGGSTRIPVASPLSITIPSGATLGTVNASLGRLMVLAINNAGTVELAVVSQAGGVNLDETTLISTTVISGTSNSNNVIYSNTARTNVTFRLVGYIEVTEATAGTWATAPSLVQGVGGQAGVAMQSLGYGQAWQNVTSSRSSGVSYYNTTGRAIEINVRATLSAGLTVAINGVSWTPVASDSTTRISFTVAIPPEAAYSVTGGFDQWYELR